MADEVERTWTDKVQDHSGNHEGEGSPGNIPDSKRPKKKRVARRPP